MAYTLFVLVLIFAAVVLKKGRKEIEPTYKMQGALPSPAEGSFYGVLQKAVGDRFIVFGKVRVADVILPVKGLSRSGWQRLFNKISAKHFDYVLCNPDTLQVHCVIELDDSSHNAKKRTKRDKFLDKSCLSADLRIHHFKAQKSYNTREISAAIFQGAAVELELSLISERGEVGRKH